MLSGGGESIGENGVGFWGGLVIGDGVIEGLGCGIEKWERCPYRVTPERHIPRVRPKGKEILISHDNFSPRHERASEVIDLHYNHSLRYRCEG